MIVLISRMKLVGFDSVLNQNIMLMTLPKEFRCDFKIQIINNVFLRIITRKLKV